MSLFGFQSDEPEKEIKLEGYNMFDALKEMRNKRSSYAERSEDFKAVFSPFMWTRLYSICETYLPFIADLASYYKLSPASFHDYLESIILIFGKHPYLSWDVYKQCYPKATEADEKTRKNVMQYYECSSKDAEEIIKFASPEQLAEINDAYTEDRAQKVKSKAKSKK